MGSRTFGVVATAVLLTLGLTGCGDAKTEAAAPSASSPASSTTADPAAEAFVRSLYSNENGGTDATEDGLDLYGTALWSARTAGLIDRTESLTAEGDQGYFDANPFCACQDNTGMRLASVTVTPKDADHADAAVVMDWTEAEPIATRRQTYNLVREGGVWKIDDIQRDPGGDYPQQPLVQDLNQWIADAEAHPAA